MSTKTYFSLVLGLSGPYGAGCSSLAEELQRIINSWPACKAIIIKVSDIISGYATEFVEEYVNVGDGPSAERRKSLQSAGTCLRTRKHKDYQSLSQELQKAVDKQQLEFIGHAIIFRLYEQRERFLKCEESNNVSTLIFIVDSLKNINDVNPLRKTYGDEFFMIFVHANVISRWERMLKYKSWSQKDYTSFIERDHIDSDEKSQKPEVGDAGQQVKKLASIADYYIVNHTHRKKLKEDGQRLLNLLFGFGHIQPTIHERCMHIAFSAANRSFCLSRQVGAAVFDEGFNLLGMGHNDVPKFGGGLYSYADKKDGRCYILGDRRCMNDTNKLERFSSLSHAIAKGIGSEVTNTTDLYSTINSIVCKSEFRESTEYCRAVHAEMEALLSAMRTGRSAVNGIMYVTTQPCHNCIKHIICAGVKQVFFREPYPKSLGDELHSDAISLDPDNDNTCENRVHFIQYEGVAPHRYHHFFALVEERKSSALEGILIEKSKLDLASQPLYARNLWPRSKNIEDPKDPMTLKEFAAVSDFHNLISQKEN